MANAYILSVLSRCKRSELRLWLPTDPIPDGLGGPEANRGIFEAQYAPSGRVLGPGTWVGVTGLPDGYRQVELDARRSAGIAAIVTPLKPAPKGKGHVLGIALEPGFYGMHRVAVRFFDCDRPALHAEREFDVLRVTVPPPAPVGARDHACQGELAAELEAVPAAVMAALASGHAAALQVAPVSRGIAQLGAFKRTGPASGRLAFTVEDTPDDVHRLAVTARCPEDGRTIMAASAPFLHQRHARVELRGPAAARSVPAEPPALFRIGPFEGLAPGSADLVHAAFGDLRAHKQAYTGKAWTFQLRAQPYRTASGAVNTATPRALGGALELGEGGDLGVILAADAAHPGLEYAVVVGGKVYVRRPIRRTGNPFAPADGTAPEGPIVMRGAGIERTVPLPDHAVLFFLDEHALTHPENGLLRDLDRASDHTGTPIVIAVHALAPCGCVSRLELDAPAAKVPEARFLGDLGMTRAQP